MTERWELCFVVGHWFQFFTPGGFRRRFAEQVIFGDEWDGLDRRQQRALLDSLTSPAPEAAICKLLADGWVPMSIEEYYGSWKLALRRIYNENV